jgi:hypothetical protein
MIIVIISLNVYQDAVVIQLDSAHNFMNVSNIALLIQIAQLDAVLSVIAHKIQSVKEKR